MDHTAESSKQVSLLELDREAGLPKGSAFRAFKRRLNQLQEGRDFEHLDARRDAGRIQALKSSGRIYPSSIQVVLLKPSGAQQVRQALGLPAEGPGGDD